MGMTIRAEISYGYSLGDDYGDGWEFAEVDDDGEPTVSWWDEDGDSFDEQAMEVLLIRSGFDEPGWPRADGYYDRLRDAKARLGVEFVSTGYEGARTLLIASGTKRATFTSGAVEIDPVAMAGAATEAMNEALADAQRVLGITPNQSKPAWLLTCYYG